MCSPTLFISIASQGLKMVSARRENRAAIYQAQEQNRIAKLNRIRKQRKMKKNKIKTKET